MRAGPRGDKHVSTALVDQAVDAFAAVLVRWRGARGRSKKQLAADMGFDPSYVSHVEARRHRPTEDFARRAEIVLEAGGGIWERFRHFDQLRQASSGLRVRPEPTVPEQWRPSSAGLMVELEEARLTFVDGEYQCLVRRHLHNAGREAVTRFPVRVAVDRYPGEPERSNRHYRDHPLTWGELNLHARCGEEPMSWQAKQDRDAFKELWLLFENDEARFPLYPGERTTIEYGYTVGDDKWGHWFQRAIRLPTRRLSVHLDFPANLRPVVWGVESSLTAEAGALKTPVLETVDQDRTHFEWQTDEPSLNARYRLEWRFRSETVPAQRGARNSVNNRPSELMRNAGILQRGAPTLDRAARWFDLPAQASLAAEVVERLLDALHRVARLYDFHKGQGLAAPQLGIDWAAAVVRAPGASSDSETLTLLNPRVVGESVDQDEQYEGCLSFFDVRGLVSRPLLVEVEHEAPTGVRTVSTYRQAMARLVVHEVDHLGGLLYSDRMPSDGRLTPIEEYQAHGEPWRYPSLGAAPTAS